MGSIADTIGNTPMVRLDRLCRHYGLAQDKVIIAKLEYFNPGGSKKDRVAKQIIVEALANGTLRRGDRVVELTSGNTGTGLALVCCAHGLHFIAIMSEGNSMERAVQMKAMGAKVVLVPQAKGSVPGQVTGEDLELIERRCVEICKETNGFRAHQFENDANWRAHYLHTSRELLQQLPSLSISRLDAFVDFVGTGGTFAGMSKRFQETGGIQCYIVEPSNAVILNPNKSVHNNSSNNNKHKIQGGGYMLAQLTMLQNSGAKVDGYLTVDDDAAIECARNLSKLEGVMGGYSSGANVAAALQLLKRPDINTVAVVICDTGLKYLSTDLYSNL